MTKAEVLDVITVIVMAYPDRIKGDSVPGMVTAWLAFFGEDNPEIVKTAVMKHIACNKWPPSIAEIRENMVTLQNPDLVPPDVAWTLVAKQMIDSKFTSFGFSDDDLYDAFPPLVAKVVSDIGWATLNEMSRGQYYGCKNGQDRQTFLEHYTPEYKREMESAMLPAAVKTAEQRLISEHTAVLPTAPVKNKYWSLINPYEN